MRTPALSHLSIYNSRVTTYDAKDSTNFTSSQLIESIYLTTQNCSSQTTSPPPIAVT